MPGWAHGGHSTGPHLLLAFLQTASTCDKGIASVAGRLPPMSRTQVGQCGCL